jgi:hypothetical protein
MKVNHVTETPAGVIKFEGELSDKELQAVITVGLNYLLSVGALVQLEKEMFKKNTDGVSH